MLRSVESEAVKMLYGGYDHNVDKKGRLAIPSKLRSEIGESFMICRSILGKRCLCIYPMSKWEELAEKINSLPMSKSGDLKRFLYDGAFNVEFDTQGRVLIPAVLRDYALIESDAHIIGLSTNLEIWNKNLWADECAKYTPESIASVMEELDF